MGYGICPSSAAAGMAALQLFYNISTGLWDTTQWWNSANALGTTIESSRLTDRIAALLNSGMNQFGTGTSQNLR